MVRNRRKLNKIGREIAQREQGRVAGRLGFFSSTFLYHLYMLVPVRFRWLVPFLEELVRDTGKEEGEEEEEETAEAISPVAVLPSRPGVDYLLIPPLAEQSDIMGVRGRYRILRVLGVRGKGRLYQGVQMGNDQPVIIREYVLPPQGFSALEIRQRKEVFMLRGGLKLADGRIHNLRLVEPWDTISDHNEARCYLVSQGEIEAYPTLLDYLKERGPLPPAQVRHILSQVLQTLASLHGQKFTLPSGQIQQGLVHGQLSLETLLISPLQGGVLPEEQRFYIYVCDLTLWEDLFLPPTTPPGNYSPAKDLVALGYVGFYLLAGRTVDKNGKPLDPRQGENWLPRDRPLQQIIRRLLGLESPFPNALEARKALLNLPPEPDILSEVEDREGEEEDTPSSGRWKGLLLVLILAALGGWGLWWWLGRRPQSQSPVPLPCCIGEVTAVPRGRFRYTTAPQSIGHYLMRQPNLVLRRNSFQEEIQIQQPNIQLEHQEVDSWERTLTLLQRDSLDFAVSSVVGENAPVALPSNLRADVIAYDGLALIVPFSYAQRAQSLPNALGGRITFAQLRQLYLGEIDNWQQLGGPRLPVRLYVPEDPEALRLFEERVLQTPDAIAQFRALTRQERTPNADSFTALASPIQTRPTFTMLREILQDFEDSGIGAIGFASLSQVFGQCSVYPLALVGDTGRTSSVSPLVQNDGTPITPNIDLCNDKGSYRLNMAALRGGDYPLAYSISIIYPLDNSRPPIGDRLAEMFRTQEAQKLLERAGFTPKH
ncbi:substrate-binding domain-containing protein [Spirulina subsalsa]|uniref:substrate-binding domain-containing protein n=1 Tax=Spirulina subsalsa TaxID=54311 RepID=UPI0002F6451F|nr:substrate-binding domain-containing protein [Spirulina subsalsa]